MTWIPCSSAVSTASRMHSARTWTATFRTGFVPIRFLHTRRRTDADLLTTLYFSASKLFHDSYFSLSTTSFDFFPFFFVPESHTEREVPKGPRFAPSKWPLPAVRQSRAMPNRVLVGGHRLYGTTGALNLHNFGIFRFLFFRN